MANFKSLEDAIVSSTLEFSNISDFTLAQFVCANGEIAGFRIYVVNSLSEQFKISQIYDISSGVPIQVGNVSVVPGIDLTGGYFSSGAFCDRDPFDPDAKFFKVDY